MSLFYLLAARWIFLIHLLLQTANATGTSFYLYRVDSADLGLVRAHGLRVRALPASAPKHHHSLTNHELLKPNSSYVLAPLAFKSALVAFDAWTKSSYSLEHPRLYTIQANDSATSGKVYGSFYNGASHHAWPFEQIVAWTPLLGQDLAKLRSLTTFEQQSKFLAHADKGSRAKRCKAEAARLVRPLMRSRNVAKKREAMEMLVNQQVSHADSATKTCKENVQRLLKTAIKDAESRKPSGWGKTARDIAASCAMGESFVGEDALGNDSQVSLDAACDRKYRRVVQETGRELDPDYGKALKPVVCDGRALGSPAKKETKITLCNKGIEAMIDEWSVLYYQKPAPELCDKQEGVYELYSDFPWDFEDNPDVRDDSPLDVPDKGDMTFSASQVLSDICYPNNTWAEARNHDFAEPPTSHSALRGNHRWRQFTEVVLQQFGLPPGTLRTSMDEGLAEFGRQHPRVYIYLYVYYPSIVHIMDPKAVQSPWHKLVSELQKYHISQDDLLAAIAGGYDEIMRSHHIMSLKMPSHMRRLLLSLRQLESGARHFRAADCMPPLHPRDESTGQHGKRRLRARAEKAAAAAAAAAHPDGFADKALEEACWKVYPNLGMGLGQAVPDDGGGNGTDVSKHGSGGLSDAAIAGISLAVGGVGGIIGYAASGPGQALIAELGASLGFTGGVGASSEAGASAGAGAGSVEVEAGAGASAEVEAGAGASAEIAQATRAAELARRLVSGLRVIARGFVNLVRAPFNFLIRAYRTIAAVRTIASEIISAARDILSELATI